VLVQSTLAEQVELLRSELHGCLAWVESFLVRAEASLGRLSAMPVVAPLVGLLDGSLGRVEADLFGSFSPRRKPCTPVFPAMSRVSKSEATVEVVASVLQIMSNLVEMYVEPHSPVPMVHLKVDSPMATAVPLTPTRTPLEGAQLLAFEEHEDVDIIPHLPEFTWQKFPMGNEVVVSGALVQVPRTIFARKLYDFIASLEVDDPGSGNTICCLLEERALRNKSKKMGSSTYLEGEVF
jgi:hypothetical protein